MNDQIAALEYQDSHQNLYQLKGNKLRNHETTNGFRKLTKDQDIRVEQD